MSPEANEPAHGFEANPAETAPNNDVLGVSRFIINQLAGVVEAGQDPNDIHSLSEEAYHTLNWRDGRSPASGDTA